MPRLLASLLAALLAALALAGCARDSSSTPAAGQDAAGADSLALDPAAADTAVFAGGCFWCMEPPFDKLDGVAATVSGYAGGDVPNPSYEQVTYGGTGHVEAMQVIYDPDRVSFETLLTVYWRNIDPLDGDGQFCDQGASYRPKLFVRTAAQRRQAEASKAAVAQRFDESLQVPIEALNDTFYPAEDYHQDYYKKNPGRYQRYRQGCRRDARLKELWGAEAGGLSVVK